jgi:F0F1-type ATP synthase epsilon subunit
MASMNLSVVTPTGAVVDTEISEATLPGAAGVFGVYPQHQPSLIMLGGGIRVKVSSLFEEAWPRYPGILCW